MYVEEWAEGKPENFISFALPLALSATNFCDFTRSLYEGGTHAGYLTFPSHREWQSYYKNHRIMSEFYQDFLALALPQHKSVMKPLLSFFSSDPKDDQVMSEGLSTSMEAFSYDYYQMCVEDPSPDSTTENMRNKIIDFMRNPKMSFWVNVYVTCNFIYAEEPGALLRKARLGNYEALERLLRLDEKMISDPRIAEQVFKLKDAGKRNQYENLLECLGKKPKLKMTLQSLKYVAAGQLSALAKLMGIKLTSSDIRALFNAISRDSGHGLEDSDLYDIEDEAFRKAIQRERPIWIERFSRDKS